MANLALTKAMPAHARSSSLRLCALRSTSRGSQSDGSMAATVNRPSGGAPAFFVDELQRVLEAPKGVGELRINEQDFQCGLLDCGASHPR